MKSIRVSKTELVKTLEENRAKHRQIFDEAVIGYREAMVRELERRLDFAKANKRVDHYINLIQPVDQTKDYDRAIGMLKLSLDTEIELSEQDYISYVLDDWSWKKQFLTSNSAYSKTASDTVAAAGYES